MITLEEFNNWCGKRKNPHLRFGQEFINDFCERIIDKLPDPELFYEKDVLICTNIILGKYVE